LHHGFLARRPGQSRVLGEVNWVLQTRRDIRCQLECMHSNEFLVSWNIWQDAQRQKRSCKELEGIAADFFKPHQLYEHSEALICLRGGPSSCDRYFAGDVLSQVQLR